MAAHAVAVAGDVQDGGVVQEAVQDGGGDGGVFEDLAPGGDAAVGGEDDRAVLVASRDDFADVLAVSRLSRASRAAVCGSFGSHGCCLTGLFVS